MVLRANFHLEIEWTRVTDEDLMWMKSKLVFKNGHIEVERDKGYARKET